MISHSKPFVTASLDKKIALLIKEKNFVSTHTLHKAKERFQKKFYLDNLHFTQSGTYSIYWILKGLRLQITDEVIVPSYVCSSVLRAVQSAGVKPVVCDIGPYWHMTRESVERCINTKTRVIILVNLFGMFLDVEEFRFPGVVIVNDLCQCPGLGIKTEKDRGDFLVFSFDPTKYLNAGGYGAFSIITKTINFFNYTSDDCLRSSLSTVNLIILEEQLEIFEEMVEKRKKIADFYFACLGDLYTTSINRKDNAFYRFPLTQNLYEFGALQQAFLEKGISVRRGVDQLVHRLVGRSDRFYPYATQAFNTTVSIPLYPSLEKIETELIVQATNQLLPHAN
jgi:perosamine synthetase